MVLGYYTPADPYTWEQLDRLTGHRDRATWPMAGALHCLAAGFRLAWIDPFDLARFGREGFSYLLHFYGSELARAQALHSDLAQEIRYAAQLAAAIDQEIRAPTRTDLETSLSAISEAFSAR